MHTLARFFCRIDPTPSFDIDRIPTFEEAFDTVSLRKFFQEQDTTNSQSVYSPHKSIPEDNRSQTALDDTEPLLSPLHLKSPEEGTCIQVAKTELKVPVILEDMNVKSRMKAYDFQFAPPVDLQPSHNVSQVSEASHTTKGSDTRVKQPPFIIHRGSPRSLQSEILSPNNKLLMATQDNSLEVSLGEQKQEELDPFWRLIKSKSVFKIQKGPKTEEINVKRGLEEIINDEEEPNGPLKRFKTNHGNPVVKSAASLGEILDEDEGLDKEVGSGKQRKKNSYNLRTTKRPRKRSQKY